MVHFSPWKRKKATTSNKEEAKPQPKADPYDYVKTKIIGHKNGTKGFCLDFLNITEEDLDLLDKIKAESSAKKPSGNNLAAIFQENIKLLNTAAGNNSASIRQSREVTESSLLRSIRSLVCNNAKMESKDGLGKLLILVFLLLRKRHS